MTELSPTAKRARVVSQAHRPEMRLSVSDAQHQLAAVLPC